MAVSPPRLGGSCNGKNENKFPKISPRSRAVSASIVKGFASIRAQIFTFFWNRLGLTFWLWRLALPYFVENFMNCTIQLVLFQWFFEPQNLRFETKLFWNFCQNPFSEEIWWCNCCHTQVKSSACGFSSTLNFSALSPLNFSQSCLKHDFLGARILSKISKFPTSETHLGRFR